jgi:tRNA threonylcarbamoyladenosine biosynthesis protein TsaB
MALILSLDSTTSFCSVAIHRDGILLAEEVNREQRAAASQMAVMIKKLLEDTKLMPQELSAIAVSSGPGSYTGLRIATSTAKGLCFALKVPLVAISSLLVLTKKVVGTVEADLFCPMLDARRMEVYCALVNDQLEFINPVQALVLTSDSFKTDLQNSKIVFFGDGADKFKPVANHKNALFVESIQPGAVELGYLAFEEFKNKNFESIETFEPFYLKDFMMNK